MKEKEKSNKILTTKDTKNHEVAKLLFPVGSSIFIQPRRINADLIFYGREKKEFLKKGPDKFNFL